MMQENSNSNQNNTEIENETTAVAEMLGGESDEVVNRVTETEVVDSDVTDSEDKQAGVQEASASDQETNPKEQVKIEFPYSEILREKAPKAFEVVEKVATDWKNESDFTDLGITHPVAGIVASQALTKAKEVEKKLEEKGVFTMAKMGLEIAKSQVESLRNKIK